MKQFSPNSWYFQISLLECWFKIVDLFAPRRSVTRSIESTLVSFLWNLDLHRSSKEATRGDRCLSYAWYRYNFVPVLKTEHPLQKYVILKFIKMLVKSYNCSEMISQLQRFNSLLRNSLPTIYLILYCMYAPILRRQRKKIKGKQSIKLKEWVQGFSNFNTVCCYLASEATIYVYLQYSLLLRFKNKYSRNDI